MISCLVFLFSFRNFLVFFKINIHLLGIDNKGILCFVSKSFILCICYTFFIGNFVNWTIFPFDTWEFKLFCDFFNLIYELSNICISNPGLTAFFLWLVNENSFNVCWGVKAVIELFYRLHSVFALNNNNCSHSRSNVLHHFIEEFFIIGLGNFIDNIWE